MELWLQGRTAAITGGSKGIGKAIAKGLAAEGVNLVLLARGREMLGQAAQEIKALRPHMTRNGSVRIITSAGSPVPAFSGIRYPREQQLSREPVDPISGA
jgi:NAD(P)-dependent dehydrogenase (short-subunit alcohol dehydrogenase family)